MSQILIVGGTASLAAGILTQLTLAGDVHATARDVSRAPSIPGVTWHPLDLEDCDSIDQFCRAIREGDLRECHFFSGTLSATLTPGPSGLRSHALSGALEVQRRVQWINALAPVAMAEYLLASGALARLSFVGSRSAFRGSHDVAYASSKSALIGAVASLQKRFPQTDVYSVSPTTVIHSRMWNTFDEVTKRRHRSRSIISIEDWTTQWLSLRDNSNVIRGQMVPIGVEDVG